MIIDNCYGIRPTERMNEKMRLTEGCKSIVTSRNREEKVGGKGGKGMIEGRLS